LFSYTCFDGTAGTGRIFADGSVVGTIRPGGRGEMRFANLPPGTLRIEGSLMCAHLSGMIVQPCFRVQKIDYRSFRGSLSGLGFGLWRFLAANPAGRQEDPRPGPAHPQDQPRAGAPRAGPPRAAGLGHTRPDGRAGERATDATAGSDRGSSKASACCRGGKTD